MVPNLYQDTFPLPSGSPCKKLVLTILLTINKTLDIIEKSQKNEGVIPTKLRISQLLVALSYRTLF